MKMAEASSSAHFTGPAGTARAGKHERGAVVLQAGYTFY